MHCFSISDIPRGGDIIQRRRTVLNDPKVKHQLAVKRLNNTTSNLVKKLSQVAIPQIKSCINNMFSAEIPQLIGRVDIHMSSFEKYFEYVTEDKITYDPDYPGEKYELTRVTVKYIQYMDYSNKLVKCEYDDFFPQIRNELETYLNFYYSKYGYKIKLRRDINPEEFKKLTNAETKELSLLMYYLEINVTDKLRH